jgi:biopolymer transport protein ExbD/biopolymer transport protein TolR
MAMNVGGRAGGPKADINITPLVDVVLVLLIIFMVVTPMMQKGVEVHLPRAHNVIQGKENSPLIITVTEAKEVYLDKDKVGMDALPDRVKTEMAAIPGRTILLKGDKALQFGEVRKVMNQIRKSGSEQISLATEKNATEASEVEAP